ncbi:hypothetical protein OEZ85_014379 [Tetradesmus obliquus]|uniref:BHLH domain-containing protein n=1 Tax=Tetradesmus obliquus TaxID=3088 RepID=A0ABY8UB05_TETOB|nr:hypothetical protein OEZ85_014379 [Tetradesmus obliquus]
MVPWGRQGIKRQSSKVGPVNVLQTYAQGPADIELFTTDSCAPLSYLSYSELLLAFPSGSVPQQPFDLKSFDLQQDASKAFLQGYEQQHSNAANSHFNSISKQQRPPRNGSMASSGDGSGNRHKRQQLLTQSDYEHSGDEGALQQYQHGSSGSPGNGFYANGKSSQHSPQKQQHQRSQDGAQEHERRKFTRNILNANNKKESLERYKAIISLIESCKRRLAALPQLQLPGASPASISWGCEPACSLLQAVLDVGEALASFGNSHFPEHSNEGRAILAGDYRALLRQYLSQFGFMFAAATKEQLPHDLQEEVQSVGSLLATRCEAYDLLYDQLVRHVGLEGRGGPSTVVLNHNSAAANPHTTITANPTNTTTASSSSKAKAVNKGLGGAAIAAAGLAGLLLVRMMRGGGGGGGRGSSRSKRGSSSSAAAGSSSLAGQQQRLRIPKGKNGRELLLVSQLSACGDEMRRAKANEELLKDDWRLGRQVRLAWPPGPPLPPGYAELAPDACNVSQLLQEMYG